MTSYITQRAMVLLGSDDNWSSPVPGRTIRTEVIRRDISMKVVLPSWARLLSLRTADIAAASVIGMSYQGSVVRWPTIADPGRRWSLTVRLTSAEVQRLQDFGVEMKCGDIPHVAGTAVLLGLGMPGVVHGHITAPWDDKDAVHLYDDSLVMAKHLRALLRIATGHRKPTSMPYKNWAAVKDWIQYSAVHGHVEILRELVGLAVGSVKGGWTSPVQVAEALSTSSFFQQLTNDVLSLDRAESRHAA